MKQICICLLLALTLIFFSACAGSTKEAEQTPPPANVSDTTISEPNITEKSDTSSPDSSEIPNEAPTVKMTVGENKLYITIYDNPTSRDLLSKLPLTLTFEDYNATEKIAYLSETLTAEGAPDSFDPDVGDVALYAPWGNLSVFYKDFRDSAGLVSIGHIDEGIETLAEKDGSFTAVLELLELK